MSDDTEAKAGNYTCAACGQTYGKTWTDEEALAETAEIFGEDAAAGDLAVVCDTCWREMMGLPPEDALP